MQSNSSSILVRHCFPRCCFTFCNYFCSFPPKVLLGFKGIKRYNLSSTYFSNYKRAWSEDRTNFTKILFKSKGNKLSLSSLILMGVWIFFYMCMSLCYISAWLHAKFLKGCNLSESFWVQGPRGVFSQVYPSHLRFGGPQLSSSSCDSVGFLKFSCLFLRICCGYSCQAIQQPLWHRGLLRSRRMH